MGDKPVIHEQPHDSGRRLYFWCPGCGNAHCVQFGTAAGPNWTSYNENPVKPTIRASVLARTDRKVCHSYVTDGQIQYLADCTHQLAGQTVDLPPWDDPWGTLTSFSDVDRSKS